MSSPVRALGACLLLGPPLWLAWRFEANLVLLLSPALAVRWLAGREQRGAHGTAPRHRAGPWAVATAAALSALLLLSAVATQQRVLVPAASAALAVAVALATRSRPRRDGPHRPPSGGPAGGRGELTGRGVGR